MRCKKEQFQEGAIFHIYNRTVSNTLMFRNDSDYLLFLVKFKKTIQFYPCSIFAYCLMPTHFHFLMRQDSNSQLFRIFNHVLSYYVQVYNRKYERRGRLLDGPLQHKQILHPHHLFLVCQYIHCNPVKDGLAVNADAWKYSNYKEWTGRRSGSLYSDELLREYFNNDSTEYERAIRNYQAEGIALPYQFTL